MTPLVLLDVDGVLNALGPADDSWSDWERGSAVAAGRTWPVRWSPSVVAAVRSWQEVADVQWLTTWGEDANAGLHALLGLPELPVAGTAQEPAAQEPAAQEPAAQEPVQGAPATDAPALAAVTPAAPDPLSGRWWKFDVVRRLVSAQPERRVVWIDDDLVAVQGVRAWTRAHADCLLVAPDPRTGLVAPHLRSVERFLRGPGAAQTG